MFSPNILMIAGWLSVLSISISLLVSVAHFKYSGSVLIGKCCILNILAAHILPDSICLHRRTLVNGILGEGPFA
jgi:hypothetical protein